MKQFPIKLTPKNSHLFPQMEFNRLLEQWREKTYNYIIKNEKNGLDLCDGNVPIDKRIIDCIRLELSSLGWLTKLAYNGTILFIYSDVNDIKKYEHSFCEDILE